VRRLVYLTAMLPGDGQSLVALVRSFAEPDPVQAHVIVDEQASTCGIAGAAAAGLFYGECAPEAVHFALSMLRPEALAPLAAPVHVTAEGAGSLPRAYIECLRDGAITLGLQRHMQAARPCDPVLEIDTDHSPFLSRPRALRDHLLALA
jgi:hypothetical protein